MQAMSDKRKRSIFLVVLQGRGIFVRMAGWEVVAVRWVVGK